MDIIIERNSVGMGDDCLAPHKVTYSLSEDATYVDLLECVKNDNYFPSVSGNNVVWVLGNDRHNCIFSYYTKTDKVFERLPEKLMRNICPDSDKLKFKYYCSPQRWKDSICRMYNDAENLAWKEEIEYCDSLMSL